MDNSVKCGNCRFFHIDVSECRKIARMDGGFPKTYKEKWCGEFKRRLIHEEGNRKLDPQKLVAQICGNCIHFRTENGVAVSKIDMGFCAYNPPILTGTKGLHFPRINKKASCSKFRAREIIIEEEPQNVLTPGKRAITLGDS